MKLTKLIVPSSLYCCLAFAHSTNAGELYKDDTKQLDLNISSMMGIFNSQEKYYPTDASSINWTEGFVKYGLSGHYKTQNTGEIYAAVAAITSFTRGDGDMAGFTNGTEDKTDLEDAYIGWKSGDLFPALGHNGLDISYGKQAYRLGDGFMVSEDAANYGYSQLYDSEGSQMINRGGAFYTAARRTFDQAAVVKIGQPEGLKAEFGWIKSNVAIQGSSEFITTDLSYSKGKNTIALDYVNFLDINERQAEILNPYLFTRKGMQAYSIHGTTDAGIENATFAFNYSIQDKNKLLTSDYEVIEKDNTDNAWFVSAGYNFNQLPWAPAVTYKYTRYSEDWDAMFISVIKLGTWLLGEVGGNFAGPYNSNQKTHMVNIEAYPSEKWVIGTNIYKTDNVSTQNKINYSNNELDLYAIYSLNENFALIPIVGFYKPKKSAEEGGSQIGSTKTNTFLGLMATINF